MKKKQGSDDDFWGPVISSYSRAQSVADGNLVDLNKMAPKACRIMKYPIAMTAAAWAIVERAVQSGNGNSYEGVVWDILWMTAKAAREIDPSTRLVQVIVAGELHTFKVICGPGDTPAPVITILLPDED